MNFISFAWFDFLLSSYIDDKIISYKLKNIKLHSDFTDLRDNPELWNVEIHSFDIYTFFISKKPVPFVVKDSEDDSLEIFFYIGDLNKFTDNNILFFIAIYPMRNPINIYRTDIYNIERLVTGENYLRKIDYSVVLFLCNMSYLYREIAELNDEDFYVSRYSEVLKRFSKPSYCIPMRFKVEVPMKKYQSDSLMINYIRRYLLHLKSYGLSKNHEAEVNELLESYCEDYEISIPNLCDEKFERIIKAINNELSLSIFDDTNIRRKIWEIYGCKIRKLYGSNDQCSFL